MYARVSAFLVAFGLVTTGLATAQETSGTISGRLVDPQGLAVPGATVTITGPQGRVHWSPTRRDDTTPHS